LSDKQPQLRTECGLRGALSVQAAQQRERIGRGVGRERERRVLGSWGLEWCEEVTEPWGEGMGTGRRWSAE
jgi:hypothetical protein